MFSQLLLISEIALFGALLSRRAELLRIACGVYCMALGFISTGLSGWCVLGLFMEHPDTIGQRLMQYGICAGAIALTVMLLLSGVGLINRRPAARRVAIFFLGVLALSQLRMPNYSGLPIMAVIYSVSHDVAPFVAIYALMKSQIIEHFNQVRPTPSAS
jgi:hypothetical protein